MSEVKKLIIGIVLVIIGLSMLLSSSSFFPYLGGLAGIVGVVMIIRSLISGKI